MYEFVDTIERAEEATLPAEALNFNGEYLENLIPGYRTLWVSGREVIETEIDTYEAGVSDGSKYQKKRYPERVLTVGYSLTAKDNHAFREAFNRLNTILDAEQAKLIFADEPDKYYVGTKQGSGDVPPGKNSITGEIEFLCPDPFKYAVNEKTALPTAEDNSRFEIDYKGAYKCFPKLEAKTDVDLGFIGYANQEGYTIQIGDAEEADAEQYLASETLIDDAFLTYDPTEWKPNIAQTVKVVSEHKQEGMVQIGTDKDGSPLIMGSVFGTGTAWHGPSITRLLPEDSNGKVGAKNCTLSWNHRYVTSGGNNAGVIQFLLTGYTSGGGKKNIAAVTYFKNRIGVNSGNVHLYVNGIMRKELSFECSAYNKVTGYHAGHSSISKFGSRFQFNIFGQIYEFDFPEMANEAVREVSIYFGSCGTFAPISLNGVYAVRFVSHSVDSWKDVPNKFGKGDVIVADCGDGKIYVNDVLTPGLGALANDWEGFCLKPGTNLIQCAYSSWARCPDVKVRYREVFL